MIKHLSIVAPVLVGLFAVALWEIACRAFNVPIFLFPKPSDIAATLIADMLKGTVAVLLLAWWCGRDCGLVAGVGAFVGHLFPVWLKPLLTSGSSGFTLLVSLVTGILFSLGPAISLSRANLAGAFFSNCCNHRFAAGRIRPV